MPVTIRTGIMKYKDPTTGEYVDISAVGDDVLSTIAPDYIDLTFPVVEGEMCFHNGSLYKANQDISTSEDWTAAHWDETTIEYEVANKADTSDLPVIPVFTQSGSTYSCDMTFAEVYAAVENKKCSECRVVINGSSACACLTMAVPGRIMFAVTMPIDTSATIFMVGYSTNDVIQVHQILLDSANKIAPIYSNYSFPVSAGDLRIVINEQNNLTTYALYRAKVDIATYETFDSTKWEICTVADETSRLSGAINGKAGEPTGTKAAGKVYGLNSNLQPVWMEQQGGGQTDIGLSIVDGKLCVTYEEASA